MKKLFFVAALFFLFCAAFTNHPHGSSNNIIQMDTTPGDVMKQYWMVFLLKGNNRSQDSVTAATIQKGHMANIDHLAKQGIIVMAGPMRYDKDLRGIFIIDAKDSATAAGYVKTDPAIIAGRLRFEIHPWWTAKGTYTFK